jgi:hypothetical protein
LKIYFPWIVKRSFNYGGFRIGWTLSIVFEMDKARIPPILVPPITSNIL